MLSSAVERLRLLPIFQPEWYLKQNPDVIGMDPAIHIVQYGAKEGRRIFDPIKIATEIYSAPLSAPDKVYLKKLDAIDVYVSTFGNVFMDEIANGICDALRLCGVKITFKNENEKDFFNPNAKIIVAPHEFFILNGGERYFNPVFMKNCIIYNTEQIQTSWFSLALPEMMCANAIIDICNQSASVFQTAGIPALHWEPAIKSVSLDLSSIKDHPLLKSVSNISDNVLWQERPVDVSFFGAQSPRRDRAFARIAPRIANFTSFIYCRRRSTPLSSGFDRALTQVAEAVAQNSKIYLNIHRDVMPYFEWHRIAKQGIGNDCVVVSDCCLGHPLYKPGIHYIQVNTRHIGDAVDWILNDPDGQRQANSIRQANRTMMNNNKLEYSNAEVLLDFIAGSLHA
ncbi:hypothetical protein [Brucella anthropi]|uniref:hypothetical protein n=1 Tax=Brucella anthropi TaxID=529 RepID=UPI001E4E7D06|nr:hypothetical protein [Brucella anthropi]UGQ21724.1 hypothetical protein LRL11_03025 [Brucella anthropi]